MRAAQVVLGLLLLANLAALGWLAGGLDPIAGARGEASVAPQHLPERVRVVPTARLAETAP